jgi:allantoate deiminase
MRRCDALGAISEEKGRLTRTFHSAAMRRANALAGNWMRQAGLEVREDAAFNLLGRLECNRTRAKTLLLGSHLDTVRDAGKYDGPLGVLAAVAAVQHLREQRIKLPFHVEIVGFSDEEGVRYQTTYLGSRALAGTLTMVDLQRVEEKGIERAKRKPGAFLGYVEVHIEQGPVLQARDLPVGVVSAIAGQSRIKVEFIGEAGHAGTVPMAQRHDALCGAAELTQAVERCGVTGTVGSLQIEPGASNVIPGRALMTLDIRDSQDARRQKAVRALRRRAGEIARRRGLQCRWITVQEKEAVGCDRNLTRLLEQCVAARGYDVLRLPSGAGHDAAAIADICPVAMLFVRCKNGISHHPAESVKISDVTVGIGVLYDLLIRLANDHA